MAKPKRQSPKADELTLTTPSIDEVLEEMKQPSPSPSPSPINASFLDQSRTLVGEVIATSSPSSMGRVLVQWAEKKDAPEERWLSAIRGIDLKQGDKVLLHQPTNWPDWVVMGALGNENDLRASHGLTTEGEGKETEGKEKEKSEEKVDLKVDGRRIELEGQEEVVLRCGQASITLRRNGRVVIRGAYVETRAKGTNRIKGGSVLIN